MSIGTTRILKAVALLSASAGLSGCVYDVGLGYASNAYYNDRYACDPYGGYDMYYDCDYGQGFANIGFGGGWYDNYFYPGYGFFLFDNVGRRYPMRDHHRRYWGEKRQFHYRERRGRNGDGRAFDGRDYTDGTRRPGVYGSPERIDRRMRADDSNRDAWREGRRTRIDQRRGSDGTGANAVPEPTTNVAQQRGGARVPSDGYGRRERPDGTNSESMRPQRVRDNSMTQQNAPTPRAVSMPPPERVTPAPRRGREAGENVRDQ